jgi:hypothetical protein
MATSDDTKRPQLFVRSSDFTDEQWYHCGGPDPEKARTGLMHIINEQIRQMMGYGHESAIGDIELKVDMMTDDEVAALPEL